MKGNITAVKQLVLQSATRLGENVTCRLAPSTEAFTVDFSTARNMDAVYGFLVATEKFPLHNFLDTFIVYIHKSYGARSDNCRQYFVQS